MSGSMLSPWLRMGGHVWRAAARLACIQRAACADHGRLRRVSATAARTVAMRLGIDAPLVTAVGHISPSAESLALLGLGDVHLRSDHAAVSVVVRYSDDEYVPPKWHIPRHLLTAQRLPCVLRMRDIVNDGMAKMELSPIQRVFYILETTRLYCQETVRNDSRQRSSQRHLLLQQLHRCERFLGRGVTEPQLHDSPARELAERQLLEVEAQLQTIRQADHARWLADRSYDEHVHSDRCSRSFFEGIRQDRVDSTIREVREGTVRSSGTKHVLRAARRFYGGRKGFFNNGVRTQRDAEARLLDALVADGRVQPASRREDLSLESICSPAAVQRAIVMAYPTTQCLDSMDSRLTTSKS